MLYFSNQEIKSEPTIPESYSSGEPDSEPTASFHYFQIQLGATARVIESELTCSGCFCIIHKCVDDAKTKRMNLDTKAG